MSFWFGKFFIVLNKIRVVVVRYSFRVLFVIIFSIFDNFFDLVRGIDSIWYIGGIRRMDVVFKEVNKFWEIVWLDVLIYVIFLMVGC